MALPAIFFGVFRVAASAAGMGAAGTWTYNTLKEWHYRVHNDQPLTIDYNEIRDSAGNLRDGWVQKGPEDAAFHRHTVPEGGTNNKYVNINDGREYIFTEFTDGRPPQIDISPDDRGSRNLYQNDVLHGIFDVPTYILFGNTEDDPTWMPQRFAEALNGLAEKYPALKFFPPIGGFYYAYKTGEYLAELIIPRFLSAFTEASPLVLDLDGDGIELISLSSDGAIFWDGDQDGIRELSGWVGADDGLLAIDLNLNGVIDGHQELFGNLIDDGFSVLSTYDSNGDGVVDAQDSAFADIVVWQDADGDGVSDEGELIALQDLGIASISVAATASNATIAGNRISHEGTYTLADGSTRAIVDAWFAYNDIVTQHDLNVDQVSLLALLLPEVRGYGNLPSLFVAHARDDALASLSAAIATKTAAEMFDPAFDLDGRFLEIMFKWAGVEGIDPESRGGYIDARKLAFLEALAGQDFEQRGSPNPYVEASATLENAFIDAFDAMLFRFLGQTAGAELFINLGEYDVAADAYTGDPSVNVAALDALVATWTYTGEDLAEAWANIFRVYEGGIGLANLTSADKAALTELVAESDAAGILTYQIVAASIFPAEGLGLNGTDGIDNLVGGAGNDQLEAGNGNDQLTGVQGHDWMDGGSGNDTLTGGEGDDVLLGGVGDDTYVYDVGLDTIRDSAGIDKLTLPTGIVLADLELDYSPNNPNDLEIYAKGELILIIEDHFTTYGSVETLQLADGTGLDLKALSGLVQGDAGNNALQGVDSALFPHDRMFGDAGNDTLTGGRGNDFLFGGVGDDTYVVSLSCDTIDDASGTDTIRFASNFLRAEMTLAIEDDDLIISFNGVRTAIVVDQFAYYGTKGAELLRFADGTTLDLLSYSFTFEGGAANERFYGHDRGAGGDIIRGMGGDDVVYAYGGNDDIDGGEGDDRLYGGLGDDTYRIGAGADEIAEDGGTDRVVFGAAYSQAAMTLQRVSSDLIVRFNGVEVLRIDGQFDDGGAVETLEFAGGATVDLLSIAYQVEGSDNGEYLYGISSGGRPDDVIRGMAGNDAIYGRAGNDTLDGGEGDDYLLGEAGDDVYIASAGADAIREYYTTGSDTIQLWQGVGLADVAFERSGYTDLIVRNRVTGDTIRVDYYFDDGAAFGGIETFRLGNGAVVAGMATRVYTANGTEYGEYLYGIEAGGSPNDRLFGFGGNDIIYGRAGNDQIDGATGNDTMYGEAGDDVYFASAGQDVIYEASGAGTDTVRLWAGVTPAGLAFERYGTDNLLIRNIATGDTLRIEDYFSTYQPFGNIEKILLSNGTPVPGLATRSYTTAGSLYDDSLYGVESGGSPNDVLLGLGGADRLYGLAGNDTVDGGAGNDQSFGGAGDDLYLASAGFDYISEASSSYGGADTLRLWAGAGLAGVAFERLGGTTDLLIRSIATGDVIQIDEYFSTSYPAGGIETILQGDGSAITGLATRQYETYGTVSGETLYGIEGGGSPDDIIFGYGGGDRLYGLAGNDRLDGGAGDDSMNGGFGNDTYRASTGADAIFEANSSSDGADTLVLWQGAGLADIVFKRIGTSDDLLIINTLTRDSITIDEYFDSFYVKGGIESVRLASGALVGAIDTTRQDLAGTAAAESLSDGAGADRLFGDDGNDTLLGHDGHDELYGEDENDLLNGGAGHDELYGGYGNDTYLASAGRDWISEIGYSDGTADTLRLWTGAQLGDIGFTRLGLSYTLRIENKLTGDLLFVRDFFNPSYPQGGIETLLLGDSTPITTLGTIAYVTTGTDTAEAIIDLTRSSSPSNRLLGLGGNDTIEAYAGNDTIDGGAGDDALYGGAGDDRYLASAGQDFIDETGSGAGGVDTLVLWQGTSAANIILERVGSYDLRIRHTGSGASITIDDYYYSGSPSGGVEQIVLSNGTAAAFMSTLPVLTVGSDVNDSISGITTGPVRTDLILGLDGHDRLYGDQGDDTLDGGDGNDTLQGGNENDLYLASRGMDLLSEDGTTGNDTIQLWAGVAAADIAFERSGRYDLAIRNTLTGDAVVVEYYFHPVLPLGNVEHILFGDGTETGPMAARQYTAIGTDADENLYGVAANGSPDDRLLGMGGDDQIEAYGGADTLDGGTGNDEMYGGEGDDIYTASSGADYLREYEGEGDDTVVLWEGARLGDIRFLEMASGYDVVILNTLTGDTLQVGRFFDADTAPGYIEHFKLFDGTEITDIRTRFYEFSGTAAADRIYAYGGTLTPNDLFYGLGGNDRIEGNDGNDLLDGGAGTDLLEGGTGNDTLEGGAGADDLDGGTGIDVASYSTAAAGIGLFLSSTTANTGDAAGDVFTSIERYLGSVFADTLSGAAGDDDLGGGDGADSMSGGAGNDTLTGGAGVDTLAGGTGSDLYIDPEGDLISEAAGQGTDTVYSGGDFSLAAIANVERLFLTGAGNVSGTGNTLANQINGNTGNNLLRGAEGDDSLSGGIGNDTLDGGIGADRMTGGAGGDTYIVGAGDTVVEAANGGIDTIESAITFGLSTTPDVENLKLTGNLAINGNGNGLANVILGNAQANALRGAGGNDTLEGGAGADTLEGGAGDDVYVDVTGDTIVELAGGGRDTICNALGFSLATLDQIEDLTLTGTQNGAATGNALANRIEGSAGANSVQGADGNDTLLGAAGNDTLDGGTGADSLAGGEGNDTYVNAAGDIVIEAENGGLDTLQSDVTVAALATNVERLFLTGSGALNGTGNGQANQMNGNAAANLLAGLTGADTIVAGAGGDTLQGGAGADRLSGGTQRDKLVPGVDSDQDVLLFSILNDSTGVTRDVIDRIDFNNEDKIDLPGAVTGIAAMVTGSVLNTATFNADLATAVTAVRLPVGRAVLFDPNGGDLDQTGMVYLIVDANGIAGYQANQDWVFQLENCNTAFLDPTDFI